MSGRKKGTKNDKNKTLLLEFLKKAEPKSYDIIKRFTKTDKGSR